nr:hypothetical protein [uncultured Dyadobacter sp.]
MNIDELRNAWEQQKQHEGMPLILEEDILRAIKHDVDSHAKVRRIAYNMSSFLFLLFFCQTC